MVAQFQSRGSQLFHAGLIAQPDAAPVVALEQNQWPVKMKPGHRKQVSAALPELSCQIHGKESEIAKRSQTFFDQALLRLIELSG